MSRSIFQDPFASLNPALSIGRSIAELLAAYRKGSSRKISDRVSELLEKRWPGSRHVLALSARILWRPATAHLYRACARPSTENRHC